MSATTGPVYPSTWRLADQVAGTADAVDKLSWLKPGDQLVSVARVVSEDSNQGTLRMEPGESDEEVESRVRRLWGLRARPSPARSWNGS